MTICLCGGMTTPRVPSLYKSEIENFADYLACRGEAVLYGGVTIGLVGQIADAFVAKGGVWKAL